MVRKKCFSPYIRCHFPRAKLLLFDKTYNSVMCIMLPSKSTPIYVYDPNVINVNYNYYYLTFTLDYTTFVKLKVRSEEHTSELQSRGHLVCRLLLEKKKTNISTYYPRDTPTI